MAKIVVRNKGRISVISRETHEERSDRLWSEKYLLFLQFIKQFGHQRYPADKESPNYKPEWVQVFNWAVVQRRVYFKGELLDWRYKLLVKANFVFDPYDTYWKYYFGKLQEYMKLNGHSNFPDNDKENASLKDWVRKQRYRKHLLSDERIKKLEDIGFEWGIKRNEWENMYLWLKKHYELHGVVPIHRDKRKPYSSQELNKLDRWICKQKEHYRKGRLSEYKINMLNEIHFDFVPIKDKLEKAWNKNFEKLLEFIDENKHSNKPVKPNHKSSLGRWLARLRMNRQKLTVDQISQLDSVGFEWTSKNTNKKL